MEFSELCDIASAELIARNLPSSYAKRLAFETEEIVKQGAETSWLEMYTEHKRYNKNPNGLLMPWLLGLCVQEADCDPLANRKLPLLNTIRAAKVAQYRDQHGCIPPDFIKDADVPDIDLDCLPAARDPIKQYAIETYGKHITDGYGPVCSVGTWQTYKLKSAIVDVCAATAEDEEQKRQMKQIAFALTTDLPDEVDDLKDGGKSQCKGRPKKNGIETECKVRHDQEACPVCGSKDTEGPTLGKLMVDHPALKDFAQRFPDIMNWAVQLIGRVRNMGMHAGALIIADRTLYGNIPMARNGKKGYWISMWSEGRNTQLSKFGYIKWDVLGLKTLEYIFNCCKLIEQNRGISFGKVRPASKEVNDLSRLLTGKDAPPAMSGWDDIDPTQSRAGHFFDCKGNKHYVDLNDPDALAFANAQKTDGVFQFDTDLAKSILANKARNFEDLMLLNAMGHPGPMASIPEAVANRDDATKAWRNTLDKTILEVLEDTHGVIVYQEQLQAIWQRVAGFTAPEAQEARKAVAKKWTHKLKPIREKWLRGAAKSLGKKEAEIWWTKMETFGRYAFNRSHAVSYCLMALKCLWLKAHFAPEFWAAVMSDCHPDKLIRYMGVARSEGWEPTAITRLGKCRIEEGVKGVVFGPTNINNLTTSFTVTGNTINQGMIGIKGIGENAAKVFEGQGEFTSLDEFIKAKSSSKTVLERFIKLGAFKTLPGHENTKAVWNYYLYAYGGGTAASKLRKEVKQKLLLQQKWDDAAIKKERDRQINEYLTLYPNRRKVPEKFHNWVPKPDDSREKVMALFTEDFSLKEILEFEKQYLGYYLHSPLDLYDTAGERSVAKAKEIALSGGDAVLEVTIKKIEYLQTKTKKDYARVYVNDGIQDALVFIWGSELAIQPSEDDKEFDHLQPGLGVQMAVHYDESRGTFSLKRGEIVIRLLDKNWREKR